jgi:quercetin dioxygenase-like cupin family protein
VVLQGTIAHTLGDGTEARMEAGDTITVPRNFVHQARNIGVQDAVLYIAFSSADRQTIGE